MLFESLIPGLIGGAVKGGATGGFLSGLGKLRQGLSGARNSLGQINQFAGLFGGGQQPQMMQQPQGFIQTPMLQQQNQNFLAAAPPVMNQPAPGPGMRPRMRGYYGR